MSRLISVAPFGSKYVVSCSECGDIDWHRDPKKAQRIGREHRRSDHPTEDEAAWDRIRAFESNLPGCATCGHSTHDTKDCPNRPWMS